MWPGSRVAMKPPARPRPDIAIVIITHNRADDLDRTLAKIAHGCSPVFVIGNACTDHTAEIVRQHSTRQCEMRYLPVALNLGAVGRNLGVAIAGAQFVAFCDDDSWWAPGAVDEAAEILQAQPRLGALTGRTLVGDDERSDPINDALRNSPLGRARGLPGPRVLGALACAMVVRSQAFLDVGGFSAVLGMIGEEALLAMDLAAAGWTVCYVDRLVAHHHPSRHRGPARARRGRELANSFLIDVMRRPAAVALRSALQLATAIVRREASADQLLRAVQRLPRALQVRRRLPDHVERDLLLLRSGRP